MLPKKDLIQTLKEEFYKAKICIDGDELKEWSLENCEGDLYRYMNELYFEKENDQTTYMLRFY